MGECHEWRRPSKAGESLSGVREKGFLLVQGCGYRSSPTKAADVASRLILNDKID